MNKFVLYLSVNSGTFLSIVMYVLLLITILYVFISQPGSEVKGKKIVLDI